MRPAHWLPPVLWMGVIMLLSTDTGSAAHTGELLLPLLHWLLPWASPGDLAAIHGLVRKGAHLTEYAILAAHESVDGGEVAGRCPGQEPVEQGQEELARVRRAAGVGRQKHDDTHPEHRGEPVGGTHRLLSYRACRVQISCTGPTGESPV